MPKLQIHTLTVSGHISTMDVNLKQLTEKIFRQQTITICSKFYESALIFTEYNPNNELNKKIINQTNALLFKFSLAIINLEFLWRIAEFKNSEHNLNLDQQHGFEWNNSSSIIDSTFLENTIIQIRAFIDFAQRLSCTALGSTKPIDKTSEFYKILQKLDSEKSKKIKDEFEKVDNTWGATIRSLRDKVVHYDIIKTNHKFRPEIQGKNYHEFSQEMANNMFFMLIMLCENLFNVKWVSGTIEEFRKKYAR
jgi:hypothetical protein